MRSLTLVVLCLTMACSSSVSGPDAGGQGGFRADAAPSQPRPDAQPQRERPDAGGGPENVGPCDQGEAQYVDDATGHCYMYFDNRRDWTDAQQACEELGGYLATMTSSEEDMDVLALLDGKEVWVGGNDVADEGVWVWPTDEAMDYTNWDEGQSDNGSGNEDCMEMRKSGRWNDDQCEHEKGYVCEKGQPL